MKIHTISSLSRDQEDLHYVNGWRGDSDTVPIYHADTPHAFNRAIGYARYKNSSAGTVLYRGQNKLHPSLLPSGARGGKCAVSDQVFEAVCGDAQLSKFLGLERLETKGWREYNWMLIEAVLQHYGANTYCMDFVDNHWCALWFGLYRFYNNHYFKRNDNGNLYVFLYVAETEGACVGGMYIGEDTYTVDLRKALPSTFQRPASQHGWVVRSKERHPVSLDERVIGVIEVSVNDACAWLGDGALLSESNFFPSYTIDQGYKVLLSRQCRSGLDANKPCVLPNNTICNYHINEMIHCSDFLNILNTRKIKSFPKGIQVNNPIDLFTLLMNVGWDKDTCAANASWNEQRPYVGQSAATAILVQRCFGGDICLTNFSSQAHYFNIVNGIVIDLTRSELHSDQAKKCYETTNYVVVKRWGGQVYKKNQDQVDRLIQNCKNNPI